MKTTRTTPTDYAGMSVTKLADHFQKLFRETACFSNQQSESLDGLRTHLRHAQAVVLRKKLATPSSKLFLAWTTFLLENNNLDRHLQFLCAIIRALTETSKLTPASVQLSVYPIAAIYTCQSSRDRLDLRMNQCLICLEPEQIREFAHLFHQRKQKALSAFIRRIFYSPSAQSIHELFIDRTPPAKMTNNAKGRFFDLDTIFDLLNGDFFQGRLPRPNIRWSANINKTRMGSYRYQTDMITINCLLDQKGVPEMVVRFVMYHEMLHKALGYRTKNGRVRTHTAQFRQMERAFPDYETAEKHLRKITCNQSGS